MGPGGGPRRWGRLTGGTGEHFLLHPGPSQQDRRRAATIPQATATPELPVVEEAGDAAEAVTGRMN